MRTWSPILSHTLVLISSIPTILYPILLVVLPSDFHGTSSFVHSVCLMLMDVPKLVKVVSFSSVVESFQ